MLLSCIGWCSRIIQEAILRDLHAELRRLLELHGVETAPQKQLAHAEPVFPANPHLMQQQMRGQYQDQPPHIHPALPSYQAASRAYIPAGAPTRPHALPDARASVGRRVRNF